MGFEYYLHVLNLFQFNWVYNFYYCVALKPYAITSIKITNGGIQVYLL